MHGGGLRFKCGMRSVFGALAMLFAATAAAGEDISARIQKSVAVLDKLDDCLGKCLQPEELSGVDCMAIIPGFYRGAAVTGEVFRDGPLFETSFGRGFISCRRGDQWSPPDAITLDAGSRATQIGENFDVVILGTSASVCSRMFSHLTIEMLSSPVAPNRSDPELKILILRGNGKISAGTHLQGAVLQPDVHANKALYGKLAENPEIFTGERAIPTRAQPLISRLSALFRR